MDSQQSMFSVEELPVRTGAWLESALAWLATAPDCSSSSYASLMSSLPVGFCSRTSLVCCQLAPARDASHHRRRPKTANPRGSDPPTGDGTSPSCWQNSVASTPTSPSVAGATPVSASAPSAASRGACWTHNTSEFPSAAVVCSLSDALETRAVPPKYFLSRTAAMGILRRAEKRGRDLPPTLRMALEQVALSPPPSKVVDGEASASMPKGLLEAI